MFFEEHEKRIYKPQWSDQGFDPLALDRLLEYHSGGQLHEWVDAVNAASAQDAPLDDPRSLEAGDVSPDGKRQKRAAAAGAELELTRVARAAFGFPEEMLMGVILERLYEFLGYMEGKGVAAGTPPASSASSPTSPESSPTTSTSTS